MTSAEIIKGLKAIRTIHNGNYAPFIDAAIKTLEQEPCEDAISRQAALNCFTATKLKKFDFVLYAREEIKNLPPVIPQEPKTGHWIRQDNTKKPLYGWYFCSECNSVIGDKPKFCSNCGARMEDKE